MALKLIHSKEKLNQAEALRLIDKVKNPHQSSLYVPSQYETRQIIRNMAHKQWLKNKENN